MPARRLKRATRPTPGPSGCRPLLAAARASRSRRDSTTGYLEIGVYDYDAPNDRKWTIAMIDRESAAKAVMSGAKKFATRDEAMRQIGMTPPQEAKSASAAPSPGG